MSWKPIVVGVDPSPAAARAAQVGLRIAAAADTDQLVYLVVVRSDILVADRPRNFPSVTVGACEIHIGVA